MVVADTSVCLIIVHLTLDEGKMWLSGNREELRDGGNTPSSPMPHRAGSGSERQSPMPPMQHLLTVLGHEVGKRSIQSLGVLVLEQSIKVGGGSN